MPHGLGFGHLPAQDYPGEDGPSRGEDLHRSGLIVLGGGLTAWGDRYLNRIRGTFYSFASSMICGPVDIKTTDLGADAAVIGAAALLLGLHKRKTETILRLLSEDRQLTVLVAEKP